VSTVSIQTSDAAHLQAIRSNDRLGFSLPEGLGSLE
jgi:hypothetical protein